MYISHIALRNVRSFKNLELDLHQQPSFSLQNPRLRTVIIGGNGTGKTTLLRAVSVGLSDEKDATGLLTENIGSLVSKGKKRATITITISNTTSEDTVLHTVIEQRNGEDILISKTPVDSTDDVGSKYFRNTLICAYGISRAIEGRPTSRTYRVIDSVYNLFDYETAIIPTELAYFRLKNNLADSTWQAMWKRIRQALGLSSHVEVRTGKRAGLVVSGPSIGDFIPLEAWADGYRRTLAWILDLYSWAMLADQLDRATGAIKGIVLIDEIEQHLHPSLQVDALSRLAKLLQETQVIATTHSPFVALGVRPNELVVLKRETDSVVPVSNVPDFYSYSVEDMAQNEDLFDTDVYNPKLSKTIARYRHLLTKRVSERTDSETNELRALAKELSRYELLRVARQDNSAFDELLTILNRHNL